MTISIRARMILLAIIAILPAITLIFYLYAAEKKAKEINRVESLKSTAKLYSEEHAQIVENARHILLALSITPQVYLENPGVCNSFLASLLKKYKRYSNFGVADAQGNVICSAVSSTQKINIANTLFFKETAKTRDFAVGEYRISQATGSAVIGFGYPLNRGVIYASVDLSWLNLLTQGLSSDQTISTLVLDRNGTVLARDPDPDKWVGRQFPNGQLMFKISQTTEGVTEDFGPDGIRRTYAFEKIGNLPGAPYIVVGTPKETIYQQAQKDFTQRILLLLIVAGICLGFAWWAGGILIVRQVEALKKIDVLKNDFVSLVSHQIRTPLTSIRWFSEILLTHSKYRLSAKQKNVVRDIHEISNEVISLVGMFLDVSKIESGKIALSCKEVDIGCLVQDVIGEIKNTISKKKIKLKLVVNPKPLKAYVDQRFIKQVYLNLIGNAIKYSHLGGRIDVSIHKKRVKIITIIKDRGIGIPTSEKNNIFQKFSRAKNASSFAPYGAGLGLYLVKLIIEAHQGKVWFKSIKRKGTSFFFSLPVNHEMI